MLRPASTLHASQDRQQHLTLIVRGAVRLQPADHTQYPADTMYQNPLLQHQSNSTKGIAPSELAADSSPQQGFLGQPQQLSMPAMPPTQGPRSGSGQPQTHPQTESGLHESGLLPPNSEMQSQGQSHEQSHGQSHGDGQVASGQKGSSQMLDRHILDAQGCAFGLPGLLQGSDLGVHVTAETLVEACSIPWSTIQVEPLPSIWSETFLVSVWCLITVQCILNGMCSIVWQKCMLAETAFCTAVRCFSTG